MAGAERAASSNFDDRPDGVIVELVVIHAISLPPGEFGGGYIDRFFQNRLRPSDHSYFRNIDGLKVSSHFLIERAGLLKQFVSINSRAWHCGESSFKGRAACNDFSVGIELEGSDEQPFTLAQYSTLTEILTVLSIRYPAITVGRIVGHSEISPGRKTDPGPQFEWQTMRKLLRDKLRVQGHEKAE